MKMSVSTIYISLSTNLNCTLRCSQSLQFSSPNLTQKCGLQKLIVYLLQYNHRDIQGRFPSCSGQCPCTCQQDEPPLVLPSWPCFPWVAKLYTEPYFQRVNLLLYIMVLLGSILKYSVDSSTISTRCFSVTSVYTRCCKRRHFKHVWYHDTRLVNSREIGEIVLNV